MHEQSGLFGERLGDVGVTGASAEVVVFLVSARLHRSDPHLHFAQNMRNSKCLAQRWIRGEGLSQN